MGACSTTGKHIILSCTLPCALCNGIHPHARCPMSPEFQSDLGLAPRGTAWYYATLHQPIARRRNLLLLQAWWCAVRRIPYTVSEPSVAAAKLAWWEAQVRLCQDKRPDHPLLLQLQPTLHEAGVAPNALLLALTNVSANLQQNRWLDWIAIENHLDSGPGQVARVCCQLAGQSAPSALAWSGALGVALAQVAMVRDVGRDARRGVVFIPVDELAAHGVKARQLLAGEDSREVRALLEHAAMRARTALVKADALRPPNMGQAALPGIALSRMARALLREMERDRYALLDQRMSLPPVRMLWAAWRAKWER